MTELEQTWRAWRLLSAPDQRQFLTLLREAYARQRETARRTNGGAHGPRVSRLMDLAVTETDLQQRGP